MEKSLHIIEKAKLNNELVLNQLKEHYLSVIQVAAYFIKRNIKVEVNNYEDADLVAGELGCIGTTKLERI
jgi:hypothetical protein